MSIRNIAFAVITVLTLCSALPPAESAEITMPEIIRNVIANEKLYSNVDLQGEAEYRSQNPPIRAMKANRSPNNVEAPIQIQILDKTLTQFQIVTQNDMYWTKEEFKGTTLEGNDISSKTVRISNGQRTKHSLNDAVFNLHDERMANPTIVEPHTLALRNGMVHVPLSVLLTGGETLSSHPLAGIYKNFAFEEPAYLGDEVIQGHRCHKIELSATKTSGNKFKGQVWLAPDRNYLPIHTVYYDSSIHKTKPISVGTVETLIEVKPGVWYPELTIINIYNELKLKKQGIPILSNTSPYRIHKVSLNPTYDKSFFEDNAPFPAGAFVYEISNGKIQKSYRVPAAPEQSRTARPTP